MATIAHALSRFLEARADRSERDPGAPDQEAVQSQVQLITSRDLARQAIKKLSLAGKPEFDPLAGPLGLVTRVLVLLGFQRDPTTQSPEDLTTSTETAVPLPPQSQALSGSTRTLAEMTSSARMGEKRMICSAPAISAFNRRLTSSARKASLILAQTYQADADSPPSNVPAAAASSRWNGCGSKRSANAII